MKTYSTDDLAGMADRTGWDRIDAMTEKELEDAIAEDPDAGIESSIINDALDVLALDNMIYDSL